VSPTGGVATPVFNPGAGSFTAPVSVTITDATPNSTIYYTTDGSTPTTMSAQYSAPLTVSSTSTVNALATANGLAASAVASATYTVSTADFTVKSESSSLSIAAGAQGTSTIMVAPPSGGTFASSVTLTCAVAGTATPVPTCSLSPASVTPGSQGATSTLTISVPAGSALLTPRSDEPSYFSAWKILGSNSSRLAILSLLTAAILVLLTLSRHQRKFRPRYAWLAAALLVALVQTACGGGGSSSTAPPESGSQTYTVTVNGVSTTANSVKVQHAATITVTVP